MELRTNRFRCPWPPGGPLQLNTETESSNHVLDLGEKLHFKQCAHHEGDRSAWEWQKRCGWQKRCPWPKKLVRGRCSAVLTCGYRCGRPLLRLDVHDWETICSDHRPSVPLPETAPFLELPRELRYMIYDFALGSYELLTAQKNSNRNALLLVSKAINQDIIDSFYRSPLLQLLITGNTFELDKKFMKNMPDTEIWGANPSGLLNRLLHSKAPEYIKRIEIRVDKSTFSDGDVYPWAHGPAHRHDNIRTFLRVCSHCEITFVINTRNHRPMTYPGFEKEFHGVLSDRGTDMTSSCGKITFRSKLVA